MRRADEAAPLSPRAARTFYNAADAWFPPGPDDEPGAGDVDVVAALALVVTDDGERARLERVLWLLEASARLGARPRRGLSWLPREARRAWLERLAASRLPPLARAVRRLRALAEQAYAEARRPAPQSFGGA